MRIKNKVLALAAVLPLAGIGLAAGAAHATTPLVSASTTIINNADSGGNGFWANDDFTRTLTINTDTTSSDCAPLSGFSATTDTCYSASVSDSGDANTIVGAFQPNQGGVTTTGDKITGPTEAVPFSGTAAYQFYAPTADVPSATVVQTTVNDNFTHPSSGMDSTSQWYLQAFTASEQGSVTGALGNWSWVYANGCEKWTDANTNHDGQSTPLADDGNITGSVCTTPVPVPTPTGTSTATPPPVSGVVGEISSFADYSYSCLDNSNFTWADGNPLQLWKCGAGGGADQQFTLAKVGGQQVLEAVAPVGKPQGPWCVTDNGAGARLTIQHCTGAGDQVISKQGPYYVFADGNVMNDAGWYTGNGAGVIAWPQVMTRNERWSLP